MADTSKNALAAILIAVIGWSFFTFADTSVKWLSDYYNIPFLLFLSGLTASAILGGVVLARKGVRGFLSPKLQLHTLRAMMIVATSFIITFALSQELPLADFYGIVFTAPFFILLFAKIILREHVGWHRAAAAVAGFAGILVITGPHFAHLNWGYPAALAGAVMIGLNTTVNRKLGSSEYWPLYGFYPALALMIFSLPAAATFEVPATAHVPVLLIYAGSLAVAQILLVFAVVKAPVTAVIAPFQYSQMLWGILFGFIIFGTTPTASTLAGSAIIVTAGLYVIWREARMKRAHLRRSPDQ